MSRTTIDPERLAAFIEGRLNPEERRGILAQLAGSEADREVYADAVAALGAPASETGVTEIAAGRRTLRRQRVPALWIAAAAVLVVGISFPLLREQLQGRATVSYAALLSASDARASFPPEPWSASRGAREALSSAAIAVRLGAKLTDLEVAIRMRDSSAATHSRAIAELLDGIPASGPVAGMFRNMAQDTSVSAARWQEFESASEAARSLSDRERVELGEWLEAGRIAAASHDSGFFRADATLAAAKHAATSPIVPAAAAPIVQRIQAEIAATTPPDWSLLQADLTQFLKEMASHEKD